jgi:hypothetical protein
MQNKTTKEVPLFLSISTYIIMLIASLLILCFQEDFKLMFFFFLFPIGPLEFIQLPDKTPDYIISFLRPPMLVFSYLIYIAFLIAFLKIRKWRTYSMLCIAFVILLFINIQGCKEALKGIALHKLPNQSLERTLSVANSAMREPSYASLSSGR